MQFRFHRLAMAGLIVCSAGAFAADPIKIGVDGPFTGGSSSMGVSHARRRAPGRRGNQQGRRRARSPDPSSSNATTKPRKEQGDEIAQEARSTRKRLLLTVGYINTGVALASQRFFPGSQDPGDEQRGHRLHRHPPSSTRNPRTTSSATPRTTAIQAPMIVEEAVTRRGYKKVDDPGRLHQLRPARPRGSGEGAEGQGHHAGRGREVQHQGRRHDGPAAQGQGSWRRSRC